MGAEMELAVVLSIVIVGAAIAIYMIRKQGFVGAMLGGTVKETFGEVHVSTKALGVTAKLKVHKLNQKDQNRIVIELTQSTLGSFESTSLELTKTELHQLRTILEQADNAM
jgi:hypothetical protein